MSFSRLGRRYKIVFPSEHGSWSLMLTPFIIGMGVGLLNPAPGAGWAVMFSLLAVLAFFLIRQPVNLWLRVRRGKARQSDKDVAVFWIALLAALVALCGIGLIVMDRTIIFWLVAPAAIMLSLTLGLTVLTGPRHLGVEVLGVIGLAISALAGYVAATNQLDSLAWMLWGISAAHNVISVLYVRLRVDQQHGRDTRRQAGWVIVAHIVTFALLIAGAATGWLPWLAVVPIGFLLIRALAAGFKRQHITNVQRFGFTEMGLALAFAAVVILAYGL